MQVTSGFTQLPADNTLKRRIYSTKRKQMTPADIARRNAQVITESIKRTEILKKAAKLYNLKPKKK